jgi:hypothetical protein
VESKLGPLGTWATEWPIVPAPGDYDSGEFGGMKIGKGNWSTRSKPAPAPLCPPHIPLDQTRAATLWSQWLTAWAMARPELCLVIYTNTYEPSFLLYYIKIHNRFRFAYSRDPLAISHDMLVLDGLQDFSWNRYWSYVFMLSSLGT